MFKLPQGWAECELKDIGEIVSGGTPSTSDPENFGGDIAWLTPADLSNYTQKYISKGNRNITEKGLKTSSAKLMPAGSVLFSSRAPIGYTVIASNPICTNQGFKNITLYNGIYNEFIYYFLKSAKNIAEKLASGTTFKEISGSKFGQIPIKLPPLNEQKRIVEKIEEEFGKIDEGIEKLKLAQEQIKQYRQSVLKAAFDGKLYKTTAWEETTLDKITSILGDGLHGTPKYYENGEYYFINGNNLNDGAIQIKEDTKKVDEIEFKKYKKELNETTVFVSINGTLGNTAFYNNEKVILGKSACYFNLLPLADKYFIRYLLKTNHFINYANTNATGSTIKNVSLKAMRAFQLKLPTIDEQKQIVAEIEKRFKVADEAEKIIAENLEKAEQLKQSILKKAFEGRLIPQDPTDEPASVLLEKIKSERKNK